MNTQSFPPILIAATLLCVAMPAAAQDSSADQSAEIVVTAERLAGSVVTEVPPVGVYDEVAIESLGASSVTEVLQALSPQTRSGGRGGGGRPVMLLNGRRVSGFAEMRDLPPEAIRRVEVFPEEVAIRYGFSPDQRVVNFILKDAFSAITLESEYRWPDGGGRSGTEAEASLLRTLPKGRLNLKAAWEREGAILESERGIVQPNGSQAFRTLEPRLDEVQLNAVLNTSWGTASGLTLNARYDERELRTLFGVPTGTTGPLIDPLEREVKEQTFGAGLTLDAPLGRWTATLTGTLDHVTRDTLTDLNNGGREPLPRDDARSRAFTGNTAVTARGSLAELPAGPLSASLKAGFDRRNFSSRSTSLAGLVRGSVNRSDWNGRASLDLPIASRKRGVLSAIGDLSVNASIAHNDLSDFGGLQSYGYGANWSPIKGVSLSATFKAEDAAPTPQQLGDPRLAFPNVQLFDFVRGETVLATVLTGGNAVLQADERRDWKFGFAWSDALIKGLSLDASYNRVRSENPVSSFPSITADTEAAFAGRIIRGVDGRIISVDQSAVNFAATRTDSLRWGLSFSKSFGQTSVGGRAAAGRPAGGGAGGGAGGASLGRFMGGADGGRWSLSLYHTAKFRDDIVLARGLPVIDLLNGGTIGNEGGSPRHSLELEGGWFYKGLGARVTGNWNSATRVDGLTGNASDLRFSGLSKLDMRMFYTFSQNKALIEKIPFLKGARVAFHVRNIFDDVIKVRDGAGATPFRYQRPYLDAVGRNFEIDFRKQF